MRRYVSHSRAASGCTIADRRCSCWIVARIRDDDYALLIITSRQVSIPAIRLRDNAFSQPSWGREVEHFDKSDVSRPRQRSSEEA